ncbi:MAG: hypothetical protein NTV54_09510 [Ignavibacteriales bacterium]|nr:hypothetical protein [Ignavibacteriales bacterium]
MTLYDLLYTQKGDILIDAVAAMECSRLQHYKLVGKEEVSRRLSSLLTLTIEAVESRDVGSMIAHAQQIARERFEAGFDLAEVQTAFNVLEEAIWKRILQHIAPAEYAEALGAVSTALGQGKDALAREYVSLASKTKAPSLNLQSLFSGTAGV